MNNFAKRTAYKVLRKFKKKPSIDDLKMIIKDEGFTIIKFNRGENSDEVKRLFLIEKIRSLAEKSDAFIYIQGECKLLFIADELHDSDLLYILCHELGHILDKKLCAESIGYTETQKEGFANEFAHYLMHPNGFVSIYLCLLKKKMIIAALLIAAAAAGAIACGDIFFKKEVLGSNQGLVANNVFVTSGGECYHKKTCFVIKNRTNISKLSIKKAREAGYRPCSLCFGAGESKGETF